MTDSCLEAWVVVDILIYMNNINLKKLKFIYTLSEFLQW